VNRALTEIYDETFKNSPLASRLPLFEAVVEPFLVQPTIIYDYPTVVSPLSKAKPTTPNT